MILDCLMGLRAAGGPRFRRCPVHLRAAGGPRSPCQKRWISLGFSRFPGFASDDKILQVGCPGRISLSYVIHHYKYECTMHCFQSAKACFSKDFQRFQESVRFYHCPRSRSREHGEPHCRYIVFPWFSSELPRGFHSFLVP